MSNKMSKKCQSVLVVMRRSKLLCQIISAINNYLVIIYINISHVLAYIFLYYFYIFFIFLYYTVQCNIAQYTTLSTPHSDFPNIRLLVAREIHANDLSISIFPSFPPQNKKKESKTAKNRSPSHNRTFAAFAKT